MKMQLVIRIIKKNINEKYDLRKMTLCTFNWCGSCTNLSSNDPFVEQWHNYENDFVKTDSRLKEIFIIASKYCRRAKGKLCYKFYTCDYELTTHIKNVYRLNEQRSNDVCICAFRTFVNTCTQDIHTHIFAFENERTKWLRIAFSYATLPASIARHLPSTTFELESEREGDQ